MADDKQKNADFIDRVVGDAKNPPETRMLTGWFGDSGEEGYRRLYTDAELNNYVDIPDDAILYSEPLRDSQPSGCVMVWIKRDAVLKPGGSAASRAARFLQGQVQQDFASAGAAGSLEKAGLRCVTEVPCGEVTGFTGQCTKQPDVGGAWPCITAIPHCVEVTGFTGKCTHAPWPNPSRYFGCTYLHCPTNDLTHIPHICNIVASGQPGCVVVNPPQGGDPEQTVGASADAEAEAIPKTAIPGCGYTKTWGVCETHLLGCGAAAQNNAAAAPGGAAAQPASAICATAIGCDITIFCHTRFRPLCVPTLICPTQPQQCFPIPSPFCPVTPGCPFGPGGGGTPVQGGGGFAAFGAAAQVVPNTQAMGCEVSGIIACPTTVNGCTVPPTSPDFKCTQSGPACPPPPTVPQTQCTQSGPLCKTSCGADCQSQQVNCTSIGPVCGHNPCTADPFACPSLGIACTALPPCPPPPTSPQLDCTLGCTQGGPACPVTNPVIACANPANAQAFGAPAPLTKVGCPPSDFVACSMFGGCPTLPKGDCTFFGCPSLAQFAAAGPGGGCTQSGPQCPTHARPQCTSFGPACPPTPATVCTQFAPCKTHQGPVCPTQFECTMFCTHGGPGCPQTQNPACFGPITVNGPQCPVHTGFNCPSQVCQSIACQSIACQPGGGVEEVGAAQLQAAPGGIHPTLWTQIQCPTSFLGCNTHFAPQCRTVPNGDCTFFGCPSRGIDCTVVTCTHVGPQCPPRPSLGGQFCPVTELCPVTRFCPVTPLCQVTQLCPITNGGPQCPVHSGFNCPSAIGCQSIQCGQSVACVSAGCQPGGGQQEFGAARPQAAQGGIHPTIWTQIGPQCPPSHLFGCTQFGPQCRTVPNGDCTFFGCPSRGIDCTVVVCTHVGPLCPPNTTATVCTQNPQCPATTMPVTDICPITNGGPQCPVHSGFNCPSALGCQSVACQSIACQPQGGGQQEAFGARAIALQPTPATHCFVCEPQAAAAVPHTAIIQCNPSLIDACPTRLIIQCNPSVIDACATRLCTHQFIQCNPSAIDACPTRFGCPTQNPVQCPPHSGFNCPSQFGCQSIACGQSIACVSAGCQPGGGQQRFGAAAFDQSTDFCPTSEGCGGRVGAVAQQFRPGGGGFQTAFINCFNQPTPATRCFICPPFGNQF